MTQPTANETRNCLKINAMLTFKKYWWQYLCVLIPVFVFWQMLFTYAINVPWFDDVEVFPGALVIWLKTDAWGGMKEMFRPNNEHRMLPGKLAGVLCYQLTGQLNMRWLALAANLNLMGILVLFWRVFRNLSLSPIYFLPLCLVVLHPQFYLASTWSITAWQHQSVLFWGFLTIYLLAKNTVKTFLLAVLTGFVTTFCMSNGLVFWGAGLALIIIQKRYKNILFWLAAAGVAGFFYFYKFNNAANTNGLAYFFEHPHESFFGFFTFFGGSFDFWQQSAIVKRAILPTLMGMLLVGFCGWWLVMFVVKNWKTSPTTEKAITTHYFLFGCLAFLFGNGFVIALLRPQFGYYVMLVGNYKLYPALLLAFGYLIYLSKPTPKVVRWPVILGCSIAFNIFSYVKFMPDVAQRRQMLAASAYNQQHNDIGLAAQINSPFADYTSYQMRFLNARKAYQYPLVFSDTALNTPLEKQKLMPQVAVERVSKTDVVVSQPDFENGNASYDAAYLVLRSATKTYVAATNQPYFAGRNPFRSPKGFTAKLLPKLYQPDDYQIGVLVVSGGDQTLFKTDQRVRVDF